MRLYACQGAFQSEIIMRHMARLIELIVFGSRWLVVPFLFGLVIGLAALIIKFGIKLADFVLPGAPEKREAQIGSKRWM